MSIIPHKSGILFPTKKENAARYNNMNKSHNYCSKFKQIEKQTQKSTYFLIPFLWCSGIGSTGLSSD